MIYILEMLRWGEDDTHHYIVGAYTTEQAAILAGEIEKSWRGGKYEPNIVYIPINATADKAKYDYHMKVIFTR